MIRKVIIIPTFRCGLNCPYCKWDLQEDGLSSNYRPSECDYEVKQELTAEELLRLMDQFVPAQFEFTGGGEPLKFKGIETVLNSVNSWAMTSNTLQDLSTLNLNNCYSWTTSFHPHISKEAKDKFISNLKLLTSKVKAVNVTLVVHPNNILNIDGLVDEFVELGASPNLHLYYDDPSFSWKSEENKKILENLKHKELIVYSDLLYEYTGLCGVSNCEGGHSYFFIGPDGKVFRCLTQLTYQWEESLKGAEFTTFDCKHQCYFPCDWWYRNKGGQ